MYAYSISARKSTVRRNGQVDGSVIEVRQYASQGFLKASSSSSRGQKIRKKNASVACCSDQNYPSTVQLPRCGVCRTFPQGSGPRRSKTFVHLQGGKGSKIKIMSGVPGVPVSNDETSSAPNTIRLPLQLFVVIRTPMMYRVPDDPRSARGWGRRQLAANSVSALHSPHH